MLLYPGGFSETEIQASLRYLKETGTSLPAGFDIHQLIDNRWSGDLQ